MLQYGYAQGIRNFIMLLKTQTKDTSAEYE